MAAFLRRWDKDALKKAESQALLAERRLREAIDLLPEGIVFLDADARYILWNKRYADIYHRSADLFAPGRRLADTLRIGVARGDYPDAKGREEEWIAERLALLKNPGVRHEQQISDGRWIMIEERKTSEGGIIGLRVDITDMKQQALALRLALARAEAANRAKSDFLTNMSHELRTPLNGVLGLAGVLAESPLEPRQRDLVQTMIASAQDLETLLSDLLDFARLEAGRVELAHEPFRLRDLAEETAAVFAPDIAAKGLALKLELQPIADETLHGDPARVKQILSNLLSNATKFTAEGSVSIQVQADGAGPARRALLRVSDTGVGFDPADADRLFNRFEQADPSLTRNFGGVGLGLAICRQLAELMGAAISAEGRPGHGATFTLDLAAPEGV
jgi:signal transduction histidine kinase